MRAAEFLIEYKREITAQKLGPALHDKMLKDPTVQRSVGNTLVRNIDPEKLIQFALEQVEQTDPSPNKQYVQWILRTYVKDANSWFEDVLSTLSDYLNKFYKLNIKKKIPSPRNDINRYESFADFMGVIDEYPDPDAVPLKDKGEAYALYEDEDWRIIVPVNKAAACYYGQGTRWCTAATKGENRFDYYNRSAPLLIALPKNPKYAGEKYQFQFGASYSNIPIFGENDLYDAVYDTYDPADPTDLGDAYENMELGQLMNEKDDPVSLAQVKGRMGASWDNMIKAYANKFPGHRWQLEMNLDAMNWG